MSESCQRCGEVDEDRRTLWMACLYDMAELGLPFESISLALKDGASRHFYILRVCKDCRADWMTAIKAWFRTPPVRESPGTGIFVRRNGATVEISEEEWRANYTGEPVRAKVAGKTS